MRKINTTQELKELLAETIVILTPLARKKYSFKREAPFFLQIIAHRKEDNWPFSSNPDWRVLTDPQAYIIIEQRKIVELLYF